MDIAPEALEALVDAGAIQSALNNPNPMTENPLTENLN
jgi:hypothetical protein